MSEPAAPKLTRQALEELQTAAPLPLDRPKSAELIVIEHEGRPVVVKDFARRSLFWRLVGPWVVSREIRALRSLEGRAPVPRVVAMIDKYAYLMEYVEGEPCNYLAAETVSPRFFEGVAEAISELHAAGWVHGDLKSFGNLIRGPEDRIWITDLATAFSREGSFGPLRRWLFERMVRIDWLALAKLKSSLAPELLTEREAHALAHPSAPVRIARAWRRLYRLVRRR
jgi:serine/threonine protein kinase